MQSLLNLTPVFRLLSASLILIIALALLYKGASDPIKAQQSPYAQQERQIVFLLTEDSGPAQTQPRQTRTT